MAFIQKNWVGILIFIILLVIVWKYVQKTKDASSSTTDQVKDTLTNLVQTFVPKPTLTSTLPTNPTPIATTGFKFGDKIYATGNYTNAYKNPALTTANLDSYKPFNANDLIGVFSAYSGAFSKVLASNPARTVYVLTSQVYTK